jgi:hypothetical protein
VANTGMRGRPIAPLVLSQQERAYLESQVHRHRVARSLSERCRAILRCAAGLPSKFVAAELGLHKHTVGKWRRRFLKDRCDGLLDEAPWPPSTYPPEGDTAGIRFAFSGPQDCDSSGPEVSPDHYQQPADLAAAEPTG